MFKNDFKKEMGYASLLNEDKGLFEEEFSSLIDDFPFEDYEEIHDFFSENRGLIVILKKTRPLLEKHVPYASFHLELDVDPLLHNCFWLLKHWIMISIMDLRTISNSLTVNLMICS